MRADIAFTRCPYCDAPKGTPCTTPAGDPLRSGPHSARTNAFLIGPNEPQEAADA